MRLQLNTPKGLGTLFFVGILAGSFQPWVSSGVAVRSGIEGDGVITLALALVGATLTLVGSKTRYRIAAGVVALLVVLIGVIDTVDILSTAGKVNPTAAIVGIHLSVGTGLWLVMLSGIGAALISFGYALGSARRPRARMVHCAGCGVSIASDLARCPSCGVPPRGNAVLSGERL